MKETESGRGSRLFKSRMGLVSRRRFLGALGAAAAGAFGGARSAFAAAAELSPRKLGSSPAAALPAGRSLPRADPGFAGASPSDLRVAQLKTKGNWNPRPDAIRRLLWEVTQRTSIEVDLEVPGLEATDPALFRHPFLYWAGTGSFGAFSDAEVKRLRRYLTYGGTVLIDSADAEPGGPFDASVRREMARILPREELARVENEHVLYKSFFLVDYQAGRTLRVPYIEGVTLEKRVVAIYCQNDLGGAWARDAFGRWEFQVSPGGERQRETAFRLGINIVMYALCLDYKEDLVHVPFILKRRR